MPAISRLKNLILLVFLIVAAVFVLFTYAVYINLLKNYASSNKQHVSFVVLKSVEELSNEMTELEQNAMGYVITGKDIYQVQFEKSLKDFPPKLDTLKAADVSDVKEKESIDSLLINIDRYVALTRSIFDEKEYDNLQILADEEMLQMDVLERLRKKIEERERYRLRWFDERRHAQLKWTLRIFIVFSVILFLFLIVAYFLITKALTARNTLQKELSDAVDSFSRIFYKSPVNNIITCMETGRVLMVNDRFVETSGFSREEALSKTITELGGLVDPAESVLLIEELKEKGSVKYKDIEGTTKNGKPVWLSVSAEVITYMGQQCILFASINITKQKENERQLLESKLLFSTVFYKSPVAFSISNAATAQIMDVNENFLRFLGYKFDELQGKSSLGLNIWANTKDRELVLTALKEGKIDNLELELRKKSGDIINVLANGDLIQLNGEDILISAFIDITSRKKAEREVMKLNASLEQIVNSRTREIADYKYAIDASSIVIVVDADYKLRYVNPLFCSISGYEMEELIGNNLESYIIDRKQGAIFKDVAQTLYAGKIWQGEIKQYKKDKSSFWTYTTIVPFLNDQEEIKQFLSISYDITDRKEVQRTLEQTVQELESTSLVLNEAQELSHIGSWENNLVTGKVIWSDELYRILEVGKDEIEPSFTAFVKFVHPEDVGPLTSDSIGWWKDGGRLRYKCRVVLRDGSIKHTFNEISATTDENGNIIKLNGIVHDRTAEHLAEQEKEKITADLIKRNTDLEKFAHIVAHNLRAPLSNIEGLSGIINAEVSSGSEVYKASEYLQESVRKLEGVIKDLNNILNIGAATYEKLENVHLYHVLETVLKDLAAELNPEDAIISDFNVETIRSINSYIEAIFKNLISNSLKFRNLDKGLVIKLSSCISNNYVYIVFEDNGLGMDMDVFGKKIFGLYNKYHIHKAGKGLGLFMTKTFVDAMGGTVKVNSRPGLGATFTISFPLNV